MVSFYRLFKIFWVMVKMQIREYIQGPGRHSIEVLLALHAIALSTNVINWKDVKEWFNEHGSKIADSTFRTRREELVKLGLAEKQPTGPLKYGVKLTSKGIKVAEIIEQMIENLDTIEQQNEKS